MPDAGLHIVPGTQSRRSETVIDDANDAFVSAVKAIKLIGLDLERWFETLEKSRGQLASEGIEVRAKFDAHMQAAFAKWREQANRDILAVPEIIR